MSQSRTAVKVGTFVLFCLVVLAALIAIFTKHKGIFTSTYEIRLRASTVSGLKQGSVVLMSGVPIGTVSGADLAPEGKGVIIRLKLQSRFKIHSDARFVIEQIGFLGDQFVAVYPQKNAGPELQPGQEVPAQEPFNVQEAVRSATTLMQQAGQTAKTVSDLVNRVDRNLLSEVNLTNVSVTLQNLRVASERVLTMVDGVTRLVDTNSRPIFISVSNLVQFSEDLSLLSQEFNQMVITNSTELNKAVKSLESTSGALQRLAGGLEKGQGLAGALLKDQDLRESVHRIAQNLETVSSNIMRHGLLYKPKQPKPAGEDRPFRGTPPH